MALSIYILNRFWYLTSLRERVSICILHEGRQCPFFFTATFLALHGMMAYRKVCLMNEWTLVGQLASKVIQLWSSFATLMLMQSLQMIPFKNLRQDKSIESVLLQNITVIIGNFTCHRKLAVIYQLSRTWSCLIRWKITKWYKSTVCHYNMHSLLFFLTTAEFSKVLTYLNVNYLTSKTGIWVTCFHVELELIYIIIFVC